MNTLLAFLLMASCQPDLTPQFAYAEPRFEVVLSQAEAAAMRASTASGVARYGGDVEFVTKLSKRSDTADLQETVTLHGARTIETWSYWAKERTADVLSSVNLEALDTRQVAAMQLAQSLNAKLAQARANPIWNEVALIANVSVRKDTPGVFMSAGDEYVRVEGPLAAALDPQVGKRVVAKGFVKAPGLIDLESFVPVKEDTLELVIMSQCPFGVKAADGIIEHLSKLGYSESDPRLDIRYIFYRRQDKTTTGAAPVTWWSLHGDSEVNENVVQIVIRDNFSQRFRSYVQKRAHEQAADWRVVAASAGFSPDEVAIIGTFITTYREKIISDEYKYVSETLGVTDGSPTYFWESQRVADIRAVAPFKDFDPASGNCGSGGH